MWNVEAPAIADYEKIEKIFDDVLLRNKKTKFSKFINAKIPIRLGGMTDCLSCNEKENKITIMVLDLLKKYKYPYLILTKSSLLSSDPYIDALDKDLAYVQYSITTPYDDISAIYEPNASLTSERLSSCKTLSNKGFYVAARLNPLFPIYPDGHFSKKRSNAEPLKYFDWDLIRMFSENGIKTVIAGFMRLSSWNLKWIKEAANNDLRYLFDPSTKQADQALHFSNEEKGYYYERIQQMCKNLNMDFTICYDGDESYETFKYLWSNPNDCCNGIGNIPAFNKNWDTIRNQKTTIGGS
jgi:DNA repair photolyase